jgi:transitional endoplasmic reticulum ATPase
MFTGKNILNKKEVINSSYKVQFFIKGDSFYEKYRVKGKGGKNYLLKLYNSSKLSKYDFSKGNLLEVEILASLNVNRTIKLVDNGEFVKDNQKYHYIVLEFISGETIKDKLEREGVFSQYEAIPIIIYLLETLQQIHSRTPVVIHNNINLNSIFLDYSNSEKPILTEFGLARYITSKSNSINLSRLNPFYIAPELYNGIFTPQSDIFSVGALLYNMIIGLPPWYFEIPKYKVTQEKLIDAIAEERKEELNFGIRGIEEFNDEHLKEVIKKALSIDIEDRFKNANDFISALKGQKVLINDIQKKENLPKSIRKKGKGFSAVAGMQELKDILYNDVIRALTEKERFEKYGIPLPNGMLLYGPPGCGKTYIAERFAEEVGFNFMEIITSDIASIYIHGTQEKIAQYFKEAEKNAPTVMFFDEIEAMVPKRSESINQSISSEVNEFLTQLNNCGERGIFIIAATNHPELIDPALLRSGRIDYKIYVPPPDFEARKGLFELYLKEKYIEIDIDYDELANQTENYVSADIKVIVDFSARTAEKKDVRISQEILIDTINQRQPSISLDELKRYEILKDKFENKKTDKSETERPFGFR